MFEYNSLIISETMNLYINTPPDSFVKNEYVYYTQMASQRGVVINITNSDFKYSRFC